MKVVTVEIAVDMLENVDPEIEGYDDLVQREALNAEEYVLATFERLAVVEDLGSQHGFYDWQSTRVADDWSDEAKALSPEPLRAPERTAEK